MTALLFLVAIAEVFAKVARPLWGGPLRAVRRVKRGIFRRAKQPMWFRFGNHYLLAHPSKSPGDTLAQFAFSIGLTPQFPRRVSMDASLEPEAAVFEHCVPEGGVAFDVGAAIGTTVLALADRVGPAGKVLAFEPVPENVDLLSQTLARNDLTQCELIAKAVWHTSGEQQRIVWSATTHVHGTMFNLDELLSRPRAQARYVEECMVETVALKDVISQYGVQVDLLKIDVQGSEVAVLEGLGDAAEAVSTVFVELHDTIGERGVTAVFEMLKGAGYDIYGLKRGGFAVRLDSPMPLTAALLAPTGPSGLHVIASRAGGASQLF